MFNNTKDTLRVFTWNNIFFFGILILYFKVLFSLTERTFFSCYMVNPHKPMAVLHGFYKIFNLFFLFPGLLQ